MAKRRIAGVAGLAVALSAAGFGSAVHAQLAPNARANAGTVTLAPGFQPDPQRVAVVANGAVPAQSANASCRGYITAAPDVVLVLAAPVPWLRAYVTSDADTTLVVRRPDGLVLCADDTYGTNPALEGSFPAGRYAVWVGAPRAGANARATLAFTAARGNHP